MTLISGMPVYLIYTYLTVYWFLPRLMPMKYRFPVAFLYFLVLSLVCGYAQSLQMKYFVYRFFATVESRPENYPGIYILLKDMLWVNVPFIMFASLKFIRDYSLEKKKKAEAEARNLQAELSLLKVQLKPHFLFNTLNNLYSLALENSPKTPEGLEKVIGMLQYILYECSEEEVGLSKEVNLIRNYLELEQMRYEDGRLLVNFHAEEVNPEIMIAPMILFTFVENCFKHGASKDPGNPFIDIRLEEDNGILRFKAVNSVISKGQKMTERTGLGLRNAARRLDHLYSGRYHLVTTKDDNKYSVLFELDTRK